MHRNAVYSGPDNAGKPSPDGEHYAPYWIAEGATRPIPTPPISHPAFERLLGRIPHELRLTFTGEQLVALSRASVPVNSPHVIDYRVSLPFFGKRFYVTVLAGRERRSLARLSAEGQLLIAKVTKVNATVFGFMVLLALLSLVILIVIVKSALGIDGHVGGSDHAMHELMRIMSEGRGR